MFVSENMHKKSEGVSQSLMLLSRLGFAESVVAKLKSNATVSLTTPPFSFPSTLILTRTFFCGPLGGY